MVVAEGATLDFTVNSVAQQSFVASDATYSQTDDFITVSSATLTGDSISFTGSGFLTSQGA